MPMVSPPVPPHEIHNCGVNGLRSPNAQLRELMIEPLMITATLVCIAANVYHCGGGFIVNRHSGAYSCSKFLSSIMNTRPICASSAAAR